MNKIVSSPGFRVKIGGEYVPQTESKIAVLEDGLELMDQLTVTILNPNRKYIQVRNALRGKRINLEGGWHSGKWRAMFNGYIAHVFPKGAKETGDTIDLIAYPVDLSDGWHVRRWVVYEDYETYSSLVSDICRVYHPNYSRQIDESPKVGGVMLPVQQGETDFEFCARIAKEAGGFNFLVKANAVFFQKPTPDYNPTYAFVLGKNINTYEIIESDSEKLNSAMTYTEMKKNSIALTPIEKSIVRARQMTQFRADPVNRSSSAGEFPDSIDVDSGVDADVAQTMADGKAADPAGDELRLILHCPGDVSLYASQCVSVKGIGWVDGIYYMNPNVVHTWDSNGYECTANLSNRREA